VSDLLVMMPKVLGEHWLVPFATLYEALLPYLGANHPANDRSVAMGILAESLHQLEALGAPYFDSVLPHALRASTDDDMTVRQNGTFCLGVLGQYGGTSALNAMQRILTALQPRMAHDEEGSIRDNAVGALARLVLGAGSALPLPSIVPAIVTSMPLKDDAGENVPAARALMHLAKDDSTRSVLAPHLAIIVGTLSRLATMHAKKLGSDALTAELRPFLEWLLTAAPELRQHVPPECSVLLAGCRLMESGSQ
jgi:hypothetical protein